MGKFQDLTGQRFGRLTVLQRADDYVSPTGKRTVRWLCKCDCGREITMLRNTLVQAQSCGCIRAEKSTAAMQDLTGQRFGRWTILEKAPLEHVRSNGLKTGWRCKCDCGTERVITSKALLNRESLSCGCLRTEAAAARIKDGVLQPYDGTMVSRLRQKKPTAGSKTGVRGVYWSNVEQCYVAKIEIRKKPITIGRFASLEKAAEARRAAEKEYFDPVIEAYDNINESSKNS